MPEPISEKSPAKMGTFKWLDACEQVSLCHLTNHCFFVLLCFHRACERLIGFVGDFSCKGRGTCQDLVDVTIGDNSCTCEGCCSCIAESDTIPDKSCTALAATEEDIVYVPYETTERVKFCCTGD